MKSILKGFGLLAVILGMTTACNFLGEDEFVGNKKLDVEAVNGPFQMKVERILGQEYLVVLNTNSDYKLAEGSLHFYSLANPSAPVKTSNVESLTLPSNVGDFEIIDGGTPALFVANRNRNELWIYDFVGTSFARRTDSNGEGLAIRTPSNVTSLLTFRRSSDNIMMLALTAQRAGTVSLLDLSTLKYVDPRNLGLSTFDAVQVVGADIYGAKFYMTPRRTNNKDDNLGVTGSRRNGVGVTKSVYLGTSDDIIVSMNAFQNALHVFRFRTFQNTANMSWELTAWEEDTVLSNGKEREGTDEEGFRGMDIDGSQNVYLSSRTDNTIYKIPRDVLLVGKDGDRNTRGFEENVRTYRLAFGGSCSLDDDIEDEILPKLGSLVVNPDGNTLWVVGLGTDKVYRMDVLGTQITNCTSVAESPQRVIGYPTTGNFSHIYVASKLGDSITVLDATSMAVQTVLTN